MTIGFTKIKGNNTLKNIYIYLAAPGLSCRIFSCVCVCVSL